MNRTTFVGAEYMGAQRYRQFDGLAMSGNFLWELGRGVTQPLVCQSEHQCSSFTPNAKYNLFSKLENDLYFNENFKTPGENLWKTCVLSREE